MAVSEKLKEKVRHLSSGPGVYLMRDRLGGVLYVGKAKSLKKRVSSYFQPSRKFRFEQPKIAAMVDLVRDVETIEVKNETEALLLEGRLIKEYKPRYNTDFVDDKRFLLVKVDMSAELPRFRLTRNRVEDGARYFGPFVHASMLRRMLYQMRREFGILLGDASPVKQADGRWRLYDDARSEIYGCDEDVTAEDYRARVEQAAEYLDGKARENLANLREEMVQAAENRNYERAAQLRDMIQSIERTTAPTRKFTRQLNLQGAGDQATLAETQQALGLPRPPQALECFDISHISGTFVVASMVHFSGGRPDRKEYRRFKIKSFIGNDDFRAMEEVVGRRYRRLHEEGRAFPDLIVIDGGRGQVNAALKAFAALELEPPPLIGLAKREETVIFAESGREDLRLPAGHPALRLLQRARDEAHRFANSFNADLRSKRLRESVLDEFPGLGAVRRAKLLEHFGGIAKLRKATPAEIQAVPGIGEKMATELHAFLQARQRQSKEEERFEELFNPQAGKTPQEE